MPDAGGNSGTNDFAFNRSYLRISLVLAGVVWFEIILTFILAKFSHIAYFASSSQSADRIGLIALVCGWPIMYGTILLAVRVLGQLSRLQENQKLSWLNLFPGGAVKTGDALLNLLTVVWPLLVAIVTAVRLIQAATGHLHPDP